MKQLLIASLFICIIFSQCEEIETLPTNTYDIAAAFNDSSDVHPEASTYQSILDRHQQQGLVGATLLVKDRNGLWIGASGYADIANDAKMGSHSLYFIASISKVFTSAAIYRYIDQGLISPDDQIAQYLPEEVAEKVDNVKNATIAHLLSHRSGIRDFYTTKFDLDRINADHDWRKEDVLKYAYNLKANFAVDEGYEYSNTNFLLLSMILERVSGQSFEQVYQETVFQPLNLTSAYYSEEVIIPDAAVKGYVDLYDNETFVESRHLYLDELGIGGDGGVAINAYDLAVFLENMVNDDFISQTSQEQMTSWFPIEGDMDTFSQTENGYGIERFNTAYESAIGHTGGIDGFTTFGFYFPQSDMTYILLCNTADASKGDLYESLFGEVLDIMFQP
ncbi:MAG: serine hydrolase [Bacteroidota bacterium]